MSSKVVKLVRADTGPDVVLTLTDRGTGLPVDLTNVNTATMRFRAKGASTILATIALTIIAPASNGQVKIVWPTGALDQPTGDYEGEIVLTMVGPKTVTVYRTVRFHIREHY